MKILLDHNKYYRFPWTLTDNAISWLEVTKACNIYCEGCYRQNDPAGHKSLEDIKRDLETLKRSRKADVLSIAGGEPLLHPNLAEIVRLAAHEGWKPNIITNGVILNSELVRELKTAGVAGFTFHVDSKQRRPEWNGKTEIELNKLRHQYAEMLASVGGLSCIFNCTVYEETLKYVPDIVAWGQRYIDIVHTLVFIAFRAILIKERFHYFAGSERIDMGQIVYSTPDNSKRVDILCTHIVEAIGTRHPEFEPSAYLNGTEKADSFKWLVSERIGTRERIYGYVGPKFMELIQTIHHFFKGKYLAQVRPSLLGHGKAILLMALLDKGVRAAAKSFLFSDWENPFHLFRKLYVQSITIIQPMDVLYNGSCNMCDGCPDITVWNNKLVSSCRLEEQMKFGCFVRAVPKRNWDSPEGAGEHENYDHQRVA